MKNLSYKLTSLLLMLSLLFSTTSCQDNGKMLDPKPEIGSENGRVEYDKRDISPKKLKNPYSLKSMEYALRNIQKIFPQFTKYDIKIKPTHLYIQFFVGTDEEKQILQQNAASFVLYDYPLDYSFKEKNGKVFYGNFTKNNFMYASVKVGTKLPQEIRYKILEQLFIPDDKSYKTIHSNLPNELIDQLIDEALKITGNLDKKEGQPNSNYFVRRSKWRPAGRITLWDDNFSSYLPLEGVKVRARRWFTTYTGITNSSGNYTCNGRFRREANYSIVWERKDFEIRKSGLGKAKYDGPKQKGDWNLTIKGGNQEFFATIFKATHHYYYKNIKGLRRPPLNSFWNTQLKIRAYYENNDTFNGIHGAGKRFLGLGSAIKIYNPQHDSRGIYGTTIHELAHASHWRMDKWHYNRADDVVAESWARGVQWELTRMVYAGYSPSYFGDYTGIVEDLVDGVGGYDQVAAYTIRNIEDALIGERYWDNWRTSIETKFNNSTENNLESLFNYWH